MKDLEVRDPVPPTKRVHKLVLTGGPCGGKTTGQAHLATFLSGTASANFRGRMLEEILSGKFPSDRYRNCVEGGYEGDTYQFGLFDSFYRIHDDIVRHTRRCVR